MADVVNLNRYRKQREREAARKEAAENRTRFGETKAERDKRGNEAAKTGKDLDDKRLD